MSSVNCLKLSPKRTVMTVFAALFVLYHAFCFLETVSNKSGVWGQKLGIKDAFWAARWKMFARADRRQTSLVFEGWANGVWTRLPMEEQYPEKWESGYRWEREPVYSSRSRQRPFARAACSEFDAEKVRMSLWRWDKTIGSVEQPYRNLSKKLIFETSCDG